MPRTAAVALPKPTKGIKPHMEGVVGRLRELPDGILADLVFDRKKVSPYDVLLRKLADAQPGFVLEFDSQRARASLTVRAKKLDLRIQFADGPDGKLYVRMAPELEEQRTARRAAIVALLSKFGPQSAMKIAVTLREKGDNTLDAGQVGAILEQMALSGHVVKREGGEWTVGRSVGGK